MLTGADPGRANHGHPMIPGVYGIFPTADGWIALVGLIGVPRMAFLELIGREDLALEADRTMMFEAIGAVTPTRSTDEWCRALAEREIRHAPVRDRAAVVADPQVHANDYVVRAGDETIVGSPIRMSAAPMRIEHDVPTLGQHTEEILGELGYGAEEIAALRADGAV